MPPVHCVDPATKKHDPKCVDCLKKCDRHKSAEEWRVCMRECLKPVDIVEKRQVRIVLPIIPSKCTNADFTRSSIRRRTSRIVARRARSLVVCMTRLACVSA
jgi:hypothetical protein